MSTLFSKNKTFIIAEAGNNHEGSFNHAIKLIDAASKTGADAIKFQTYLVEKFISIREKKRFQNLKKFQLSHEQYYSLWEYCKKKKIIFFSTPFDKDSAIFLNKFQKIFKIASSDNNNISLIEQILKFKKKTIISTGILNNFEIQKLFNYIKKISKLKNIGLAHCVSNYPVDYNDVNIRKITYLIKKYPKINIGYSDHSIGMSAPLAAVTLGAKFVEKHFTLDNNFSRFRDHKLALNPKNFELMVSEIRNTEKINNSNNQKQMNFKSKFLLRRSVYATADIKIGENIDDSNSILLRPNNINKNASFIKLKKLKAKKNYKKNDEIKIK